MTGASKFQLCNWQRGVFGDHSISVLRRFVLVRLVLYRNGITDLCTPGLKRIANDLGVDCTSVSRAISEGVRKGWLVSTRRGQANNCFGFVFPGNLNPVPDLAPVPYQANPDLAPVPYQANPDLAPVPYQTGSRFSTRAVPIWHPCSSERGENRNQSLVSNKDFGASRKPNGSLNGRRKKKGGSTPLNPRVALKGATVDAPGARAPGHFLSNGRGAAEPATNKSSSPPPQEGAAPPSPPSQPADERTELYAYGREVLGKNAGGQITKLIQAKRGNLGEARQALMAAQGKHKPAQWIGAIIRNAGIKPAEVMPIGILSEREKKIFAKAEELWGRASVPLINRLLKAKDGDIDAWSEALALAKQQADPIGYIKQDIRTCEANLAAGRRYDGCSHSRGVII